MVVLSSSTQQSITFTKKMIEDNSTMDETLQFLSVSSHILLSTESDVLFSSLFVGSTGSFL